MQGLDSWLEAPYVNAARAEAAFEAWAEKNMPDLDYDDAPAVDAAWQDFEDAQDAGYDGLDDEPDDYRDDDYYADRAQDDYDRSVYGS